MPDVVVPDDLSELAADVAAYHRELRRARRRDRLATLLLTRRWTRYGLSGPVVAAVLIVVAVIGSTLTVLTTQRDRVVLAQRPLAVTTTAPGRPGGLLPDTRVVVDGAAASARILRPGLLLLLPPGPCRCPGAVRAAVGAAESYGLRVYLVTDRRGAVEAAALASQRGGGNAYAEVVVDTTGALRAAYAPRASGPMAVFVHSDGIVDGAPLPVEPAARLEGRVDRLLPAAR